MMEKNVSPGASSSEKCVEMETEVEKNLDGITVVEDAKKEVKPLQEGSSKDDDNKKEELSDEERPRIFLRDFSEITEVDSDQEDKVEEIFISDSDGEVSSNNITQQSNLSKAKAASRLAKLAPRNNADKLPEPDDMELTAEVDSYNNLNSTLSKTCGKLASWLRHQVQLENTDKLVTRKQPTQKDVPARRSKAPARQTKSVTSSSATPSSVSYLLPPSNTYRIENGRLVLASDMSPVGGLTISAPENQDDHEVTIIAEQIASKDLHPLQKPRSLVRPPQHPQLDFPVRSPPTILATPKARQIPQQQPVQTFSDGVTLTPINVNQYEVSAGYRPILPSPSPTSLSVRNPPPVQLQNVSNAKPSKSAQYSGIAAKRIPAKNLVKSNSRVPAQDNVTAGNQKPLPGTIDDQNNTSKTFPSLVVQVQACLKVKPNKETLQKTRGILDSSVKSALVQTPAKFTEWLMRRGLLKLKHYCQVHSYKAFLLGIYPNVNMQPFSGGYVWKSECCVDKQLSVFQGSIFEGSKYPPGTILKLIYHWVCQTPYASILQWVNVSCLYLKNFFALMRALCTSWLHESGPLLGGASKYVEVGVITIGSSIDTNRGLKNVKVEILGVFDPATKLIRLKIINGLLNLPESDNPTATEQGARVFQILWPIIHWVDKRSILLVDGIIDVALLYEVGFQNVQLCNRTGGKSAFTNKNVMNYLTNVVPKMFSSTLSVLSKSIVQQFLDELCWREIFGSTPSACFESLLSQIGQLTMADFRGGESLISRLNRTAQSPLTDWSWSPEKQMRRSPKCTIPMRLRNEPGIAECILRVTKEEAKNLLPPPPPPPVYTASRLTPTGAKKQQPPTTGALKALYSEIANSVANSTTAVAQKRKSLQTLSTTTPSPPLKKLKMNRSAAPASVKKKFHTLNANLTVPIDTNEKFGGSKFKIVIPGYVKGICAECEQDVAKQNHFVGRLTCNKCRFRTACQVAMDLHHVKNHQPGSMSLKPGVKTNQVKILEDSMHCKCGFSSNHPTKLANHMIYCEKMTIYRNSKNIEVSMSTSEAAPTRGDDNLSYANAST